MRRFYFVVIIICILLGSIIFADYFVGTIKKYDQIRSETLLFQTEVAPLITTTRRLQPNLNDRFNNETDEKLDTQRLFRTDEYGMVLGPSEVTYSTSSKKILFLGGSTTENNEVDEQFRFPFLAPFQLSKDSNFLYEGINAGVRGHTTSDSLNLYLNHPSPKIREAEIVIVMHNINDRLKLTLNESYKSNLHNKSNLTLNGIFGEAKYLLDSFWNWAILKSNLLFLIDKIISKTKSYGQNENIIFINENALDKYSGIAPSRIKLYEQNLRNLVAVIKANKQMPILMTQPLGKYSKDQTVFNDAIRQVGISEKVKIIDLARKIESLKSPDIFFLSDNIHFNNSGSKWASYEIAHYLQVQGIIKKNTISKPTMNCPDLLIGSGSLINSPLHEDIFRGRYPSFDKNEKRILFQENNSFGSFIAIYDFKNGFRRDLVKSPDPHGLEHPTWVDDNKIIYTYRSGDKRQLTILQLNDNTSRPLFANQKIQGAISNIGPDGSIYFAGYQNLSEKPPELYVYNKSHDNPKVFNSGAESWRPFSTIDNQVYFINNKSGVFQIYSKKVDDITDFSRRVIPTDFEQWDPTISDDGKLLAFAQREAQNFDIYILKINNNNEIKERILSTTEDEWDPRFSPSGRYLIYAATSPFGDQIRAKCLK
jgi:hypothetical protein